MYRMHLPSNYIKNFGKDNNYIDIDLNDLLSLRIIEQYIVVTTGKSKQFAIAYLDDFDRNLTFNHMVNSWESHKAQSV